MYVSCVFLVERVQPWTWATDGYDFSEISACASVAMIPTTPWRWHRSRPLHRRRRGEDAKGRKVERKHKKASDENEKTRTNNPQRFINLKSPQPPPPPPQDEIFGPILPVLTVQSIDEAIAISATRPTPLAAYVYERDSAVRKKWLAEVPSGGACVNDCIVHM